MGCWVGWHFGIEVRAAEGVGRAVYCVGYLGTAACDLTRTGRWVGNPFTKTHVFSTCIPGMSSAFLVFLAYYIETETPRSGI